MTYSDIKLVANALLRRHSRFVTSSLLAENSLPITRINNACVPPRLTPVLSSFPTRLYSTSPTVKVNNGERIELIPGITSQQSSYGSLGDPTSSLDSFGGSAVFDSHGMKNATPTSWQPQNDADVQHVTSQALIYELARTINGTIEKVVPWYLKVMPQSYFRQVPPYLRLEHVKALAALVDANMDLYLNLKSKTSDGRTVYTFIRPTTEPGTLLSMVEELPKCDHTTTPSLTRLHVFSAADDSFSLNMFVMGTSKPRPQKSSANGKSVASSTHYRDTILKFASEVRNKKYLSEYPDLDPNEACFEESNLESYIGTCRDNYLKIICEHPERFLRQRLLFESVSGTEGCEARFEEAVHELQGSINGNKGKQYWLDVAMANSLPQVALEHTCRLLFLQGFDVGRARLDIIPDGDNGSVTMLRLLVHHDLADNEAPANIDANNVDDTTSKFNRLIYNLKRSKWLDDTTKKLVFEDEPWLGVKRGEIITAMCNLLHPILNKINGSDGSNVYSKHNILVCVHETKVSANYISSDPISHFFLAKPNTLSQNLLNVGSCDQL